jgi:hypothetical protein
MPWSPISEARESPATAKEIRLLCPHCKNSVYVVLPYKPGAWTRQGLIREAIDEHRRVCTTADIMQGFVYDIEYPRA